MTEADAPERADDPLARRFLADIRQNAANREILERLPALGLSDCWLVAGCLFQTCWNLKAGRPPAEGIRDYDLFYCDPADLSWEAEDRAIRRVTAAFADLGVAVELRNQARVHLWYRQRFGEDSAPIRSSREAIGRFLVACTCVGVRPASAGDLALCAPFGLADLYDGVLRPNPRRPTTDLFRAKAASYGQRWSWLRVEEGA